MCKMRKMRKGEVWAEGREKGGGGIEVAYKDILVVGVRRRAS